MSQVEHSELIRDIVAKFSHGDTRLFVTNTGVAWQGRIAEKTRDRIVILEPRPVHFGVVGISDITGLSLGVYVAIECKTGNARATKEQVSFLQMVVRLGGRAGIARSLEDGARILKGEYVGLKL